MEYRRKERNSKTALFVVVLIMWLIPTFIYAQQTIRFKHISSEEKLSQSSVYCILQDSKGFMWFGTQEGLNRYDGYKFKIYKHDPEEDNTISDDYIWTILEDKDHVLWVGTYNGLNKFNRKKDVFERFFQDKSKTHSLSYNDVRVLCEDRSGMIWIGTYGGGLNALDRETDHFIHYKHDETPGSLSHNEVTAIYEDKDEVIWVGTTSGLNRFNKEAEEFKYFNHEPGNPKSLSHNEVTSIFEDNSGTLWVGTKEGLNRFDRDAGNFKCFMHIAKDIYSLSHNEVTSIFEDSENVFWIGTRGGGLNILDRKTNKFTPYISNSADPHSLSSDRILAIYEDLSGVLWVGTRIGGLNILSRRSRQFTLYQHIATNPNSLSRNAVRAIFEDRSGMIWIGTLGGGLNKFDRKENRFTHYKSNASDPHTLSHDDVTALCEDRAGVLWIGTDGGGLNRFDRKNEEFTHFLHKTDNIYSIGHNSVKAILEDKSGSLWIGTLGGGLNRFDKKLQKFIRHPHNKEKINNLTDRIRCIFEDSNGALWIGTDGGLILFDRDNKNFSERFQFIVGDNKSLSHNRVRCIYEDKSGTMWIGTRGGLNKFVNREKGHFKVFREKDGLPNKVIYGILEDQDGNLWLSTNNGISKFNPEAGTFKNYNVEDGLQSNEFNAGAYYKNSKGEMFFGGVRGFSSFYPDRIINSADVHNVIITGFYLYNRPVSPHHPKKDSGSPLQNVIDETKDITLSYKKKVFSFEFAALHYVSPGINKYRYMLEGWDDDWIETDSKNRRATYTSLSPGDYIFRVQGSNSDGIWNEEGSSIKVKILPSPWETPLAYFLYALGVAAILFLIFWSWGQRKKASLVQVLEKEVAERTEKLEKAKEEAEEANKAKSQLLANVSHEIRTLLNSIVGFTRQALKTKLNKEQKGYLKRVDTSADDLTRIIGDILDFSKIESGELSIDHSEFHIGDVLDDVMENFKKQAKRKDIKLSLVKKNDVPDNLVGDDLRLKQILNNLISNAIKFTAKGSVTLEVYCTKRNKADARIRFSVEDTGTGISKEHIKKIYLPYEQLTDEIKMKVKGVGLGLTISKQLLDFMKGKMEVESELGKGSKFTFEIPFDVPPLKKEDVVENPEENEKEYDFSGLTGIHVLVVEDDKTSRILMEDVLSKVGVKVDFAEDGHEAIRKVDSMSYDIVLMDMLLPGIDGFETIKRIRRDQRFAKLPIISVTGYAVVGDAARCKDAGANEYIKKPIDSDKLLLTIKKWVTKRGK